MNHRALACSKHGLSFTYEHLSTWDEVTAALTIKEALPGRGLGGLLNLGVGLGFHAFESAYRAKDGRLKCATEGDKFRGRHSVAAEIWDATEDEIVFANNWGEKWGENGKGRISREYFESHVDCAMLTRPAWIGPSPAMDQNIRKLSLERKTPLKHPITYLDSWFTPNRPSGKEMQFNGLTLTIARRMLYTFANNTPMDVIEIRESDALCGRMHVLHDRKSAISSITELWVHPRYRRIRIGSLLVSSSVQLARDTKCSRIKLLLHEADASSIGIPRASAFAGSLGFSWNEDSQWRPNWRAWGVREIPSA